MLILCDSRENEKSGLLGFQHEAIEWCQICALPYADYWGVLKDGHLIPIVFERKAIGDFFDSFGGRYSKEKKKLVKAHKDGVHYIVIVEASISEIHGGFKYSSKNGRDLLRTIFTWYVRYGVGFAFVNNREEMSFYISEMFYAYGKNRMNKLKMASKAVTK